LINLHIPAAENIRLFFGQPKPEKADTKLFGPKALARMGCNPFSLNGSIII
jgi:hypothetical protein